MDSNQFRYGHRPVHSLHQLRLLNRCRANVLFILWHIMTVDNMGLRWELDAALHPDAPFYCLNMTLDLWPHYLDGFADTPHFDYPRFL